MHGNRHIRTPWRPWLIAWVGTAVLGVANGAARAALYEEKIGTGRAHYASTATLVLLLSAYMRALESAWPIPSRRAALGIGCAWSGLTVAFEFGFGHFVAHDTWSALLDQYNLARGKIWLVIPVWMTIGPAVLRTSLRRDTEPNCRARLPVVSRGV